LKDQGAGDLGARMQAAFDETLRERATVLLIGSDCPAMTARHLRQAARALHEGHDAVFIPCEDGGYALIGLKHAAAGLFDAVEWGSAEVMATTRTRLAGLGWRWLELETLWDVDRPEDYQRLIDSGLLDRRFAAA
jgi:rSAM/selenodomain-associated transferase 1